MGNAGDADEAMAPAVSALVAGGDVTEVAGTDVNVPSTEKVAVAGIVVAAGSGQRLGADLPKAFVEVAGHALVAWAVDGLRVSGISQFVVVVPSDWVSRARAMLDSGVTVVAGGASRTASVAAGLAAVADDIEVVAVHDAARAFVSPEVVTRVVAAVAGSSNVVAAAPGLPVADTLKRVDRHGDVATVVDTVDRAGLVAIQTPQVFPRSVLVMAHRMAAAQGTTAADDLALVEELVAAGTVEGRVVVTVGSGRAFKVTHPADLELAEALMAHLHANSRTRPSPPSGIDATGSTPGGST